LGFSDASGVSSDDNNLPPHAVYFPLFLCALRALGGEIFFFLLPGI
jgi:hypothetical protein